MQSSRCQPQRPLLSRAAILLTLSATACSLPAEPADLDLGSGPPEAGTVRPGALEGTAMTFVSYGGTYQKGQEEAAVDPFAEESGARVVTDGPTDYAKIASQVEAGVVTWDVVDTDAIWGSAHCGDLLMPLDYSIIDKSRIPEGLAGECTVPAMQYGMVLVYNTEKYRGRPPGSWADFFDTEAFPGRRAISGIPNDAAPGPYEAALLADGVSPDDLYPLDVDRAHERLDTVRDDLVFWETGAEQQQLLESEEVDMAMVWSGRGYAAVRNGAPFAVTWDQWLPVMDSLGVVKGSRNPRSSMALINYYLGARQQEDLTELTSYSPINTEAEPDLDPTARSFLTTQPGVKEKAAPVDIEWWAEHQEELIQGWSTWLAGR
ncbi:putative spermidine/putrescine transport system substrate-binding protein [Spinactinospora alkalitolerans]|uniref:Putative spermidine/putrescine transport system substrate-binding protein n=1 Tax=Spinactinospora alkalitolerans TaxID=687207 RepID=A0A852TVX0_9ACTN|nr:ABC transporter substrate-binding protein [Spinactinospora alkalitolerans]NYE47871.1 putative spermidine/putrescine transport system substrate-binding protein [Spinactinospora alkalitolerans]